jgi:hypothetical protein
MVLAIACAKELHAHLRRKGFAAAHKQNTKRLAHQGQRYLAPALGNRAY